MLIYGNVVQQQPVGGIHLSDHLWVARVAGVRVVAFYQLLVPPFDLFEGALSQAQNSKRFLKVIKGQVRAQWVQSMIFISGPSFFSTAPFMAAKCGQGEPIGLPFFMQEANAMASAPRSTIILALVTAFFPQQPPHERNPMISTGPVSAKAKVPSLATLKSVLPGHMSSVSWQRMTPTFMLVFLP
jgi:hypothetical protein